MGSDHGTHHKDHHGAHAEEHAHASVSLYWIFAAVLCLITFCEWGLFKGRNALGISNTTLVAGLLSMSLVKFAMVCGWYMHLRYDNKMLTKIFVFSALLACGVFLIVRLCL